MNEADREEAPAGSDPASVGADPGEGAFLDLHIQREALERRLVLVQQQQQFGTNADAIAQAGTEERAALLDLDRVLTLIRAAEYRRQPGARRW